METGLLHLHSVLRWVILILLVVSIFAAFAKKNNLKKLALPLLISSHIMLLVGIFQWFWGRYGILKATLPQGESVMKNKFYRFFWVEHPLLMIVAILLVTLGHSQAKINNHKKVVTYFAIALLAILAAVPWPFREIVGEGRGWLPGMK